MIAFSLSYWPNKLSPSIVRGFPWCNWSLSDLLKVPALLERGDWSNQYLLRDAVGVLQYHNWPRGDPVVVLNNALILTCNSMMVVNIVLQFYWE
jgi:hypothetical protein